MWWEPPSDRGVMWSTWVALVLQPGAWQVWLSRSSTAALRARQFDGSGSLVSLLAHGVGVCDWQLGLPGGASSGHPGWLQTLTLGLGMSWGARLLPGDHGTEADGQVIATRLRSR